jgi:hypothetical protein
VKRVSVVVAIVYFILMAVAVTFPGLSLVNTVRPLVLGIPFVFAWILIWVAGSTPVFYFLYRSFYK